MAPPSTPTTPTGASQATEQEQLLKNITRELDKRIEAIDALDNIFEKDSKEFDKLIQAIEKKDTRDISKQTKLLERNLQNARKNVNKGLDDLIKDLDTKIKSTSVPQTEKAQLNIKLDQLKGSRASLNSALERSVEDKIKELDNITQTLDATDAADIKKLQAAGFDQQIQDKLVNIKKQSLETGSEIVNQTLTDDIVEQLKTLTLSTDSLSSAGGKLVAAPFLLSLVKKRMQDVGIDTSVGGLAQAVTAPAGETLGRAKNMMSGNTPQAFLLQVNNLTNMYEGISKSLTGIPLRMMDFAIKQGIQVKKDNFEFLNNLEEMQNEFAGKSGIGKNFKELNDTLKETRRIAYLTGFEKEGRTSLYGELGDELIYKQIKETGNIIKAMGPYAEMMSQAVTRNIKEADARVSDYYYKAKKLMNLSDEDILNLTNRAVALGKSFPDVFHDISKATSDAAKKFNLDFKLMTSDVLTLRKNITDFAHKSADELATVVANVRRMGVSMNDAMGVFSRVDSFETAATTAAQLNQTFGMVIDSMELLKAESPDEILQQYKDAFAMSGKSFETMNRFERSLILQQTGLSDQAAQAIFSLENAGKTYEEVMATVSQKDPTAEQIAQMEDMDHAIQRNYKTMDSYNGMMNMLAKTMNEKMYKESKAVRDSFESMADEAQRVNHEFGKFKVFGEGEALDKSVKVITGQFDQLKEKILVDRDVLLKPLENSIKEGGKLIEAVQTGNKEQMEKSINAMLTTTQNFQEKALAAGVEIALKSADGFTKIIEPTAETIKKITVETPERLIRAVATPQNIESVQGVIANSKKVVDYATNQAVGAINNIEKIITDDVPKILEIYNNDKKQMAEKTLGIYNIIMQRLDSGQMQPKNNTENTTGNVNNVMIPNTQTNDLNNTRSIFASDTAQLQQEVNELRQKINNNNASRPIEINLSLDGEQITRAVIKQDILTKLTNPNFMGNRPTLKTSSVETKDGQNRSNAYPEQ